MIANNEALEARLQENFGALVYELTQYPVKVQKRVRASYVPPILRRVWLDEDAPLL